MTRQTRRHHLLGSVFDAMQEWAFASRADLHAGLASAQASMQATQAQAMARLGLARSALAQGEDPWDISQHLLMVGFFRNLLSRASAAYTRTTAEILRLARLGYVSMLISQLGYRQGADPAPR